MAALFQRLSAALMVVTALSILAAPVAAQSKAERQKQRAAKKPQPTTLKLTDVPYPPSLPGRQTVVTEKSKDFLKAPSTISSDVAVAKEAPTVDFLYFPGQDYLGNPWSNWGDGTVAGGKHYSAIGDHFSADSRKPDRKSDGNAFVYEYDPETKSIRTLVDVAKTLNMPKGHYVPGKIHTRLDMGSDGWLYFATHRGSGGATTDTYHYKGDWLLRANPATGKTEVVVHAPVHKHAIPTGMLDPDRLIFYGGTTHGSKETPQQGIRFFAYDAKNGKLLYEGPDGPSRYMMLARSTGKLYFVPGKDEGPLMVFDPESGKPPQSVGTTIGIRAATAETPQGFIYTVSLGQRASDADVWEFNTKTEKAKRIGSVAVGSQSYVASMHVDPVTGRYLYYVPGAHGGAERDGSPVVQFDVKTGKKKVIAYLHPYFEKKYGITLKGTYSTSVSEEGDKVFVTWNVSRNTKPWDSCGLTVVHIPASERQP